jgi:hypothetical protein
MIIIYVKQHKLVKHILISFTHVNSIYIYYNIKIDAQAM